MKSAWCTPPCEYQSSVPAVLVIALRMSQKTWKTFSSASYFYWLDIGLFVIYSQSIYAKPKTKPEERCLRQLIYVHSIHVFEKGILRWWKTLECRRVKIREFYISWPWYYFLEFLFFVSGAKSFNYRSINISLYNSL